MLHAIAAAVLLSSSAIAVCGASPARQVYVINVTLPQPVPTLLAVQVCAGLYNRGASANASAPAAYTLMRSEDATWLQLLSPSIPWPPTVTPIAAFLAACLAPGGPASGGTLRYSYAAQQELVPNVLTLAAVLAAVPLEDGSPYAPPPGTPVAYDVLEQWAGWRSINATRFMFIAYGNSTTGLAKMNPGWDVHGAQPLNPPLSQSPDVSLGDWIVSQRLFNFFLLNGCIPGTEEHALMEELALAWPSPVAVWGYDDTYAVAGYIFEAETTCVSSHNLGQIATVGVNNLAFYALAPPITAPLLQNTAPAVEFNASRTYITFVVGDGDNIDFVKGSRFNWMQQRLSACAGAAQEAASSDLAAARRARAACPPLAWTISPHLATAAPDMLRWYYTSSYTTGVDYFTLPPSGHLYAYPALMQPADQAAFVAATEADATLLNASSTVEWEFVGTWASAIKDYLPRYAARGIVRGLFAVNVPYMLPVDEFAADEFYKVLKSPTSPSSTVLFRPFEWRGTSGSADPALHPFLLSAAEMAAKINAFAPTVTHIYLTSDGGAQLSDLSDLAALLDEHVEIVAPGAAADLALARAAWGKGGV